MGSEAPSRVPGSMALSPWGGARRTPLLLEGNALLTSLGFSKHFNLKIFLRC